MAWLNRRKRKSTGPLMTIHNRGGGQTGGTRSHAVGQSDSPAVPAASEPADDAVPWAWPGGEVTPAAEDPPEVEAPSFWDWEPAGDSSGLEDSAGSGDSPDSGGASDFGDVGDSWDSAEGAEDPWDLGRDAAEGPGGEGPGG